MRKITKRLGILTAACALLCCGAGAAYSFNAFAADESNALSLTMWEDTSIRVSSNGNGLRFRATVTNYSADYEYHMVIVPAKYLEQEEYVNTGEHVKDLNKLIEDLNTKYEADMTLNDQVCKPTTYNGETIIQASITDILYHNSVNEFKAIAYAKLGDSYVYSDFSTPDSVTEVAAEYLSLVTEAENKAVFTDYVETGIRRAVGLEEENKETPTLTATMDDVTVIAGQSAAATYTLKTEDETVVEGLDFLVSGVDVTYTYYAAEDQIAVAKTKAVEGITFENGAIKADTRALTRSGKATASFVVDQVTAANEFTVQVIQNEKNIFASAYMQSYYGYGWTFVDSTTASREYDETEGAMKVTKNKTEENLGVTARTHAMYLAVDELKFMLSQGYNLLTFEVKGDDGTEVWLYNKVRSNKNNSGNAYLDDHNLEDGACSTAKVYKKLAFDGSDYQTVTINIESFIALNPEVEFLGLGVHGAVGKSIYFKNATFSAGIFSEGCSWSASSVNIVSKYDETEQAMKVSVSRETGSDGLTGRNFVVYYPIETLKKAYENGNKTMYFSAKASVDAQLRIYAKKSAGLDIGGIVDAKEAINADTSAVTTTAKGVYGDYTLTTEYATYAIDLATFFTAKYNYVKYADINYIGIVVAVTSAADVYFKDSVFTESALSYDYESVNLFAESYAASWTVQAPTNTGKEFDTTNTALKITSKSNDNNSAQFGSNNRRVYILATELRKAYNAGATTFSFEYYSSLTGNHCGFSVRTNSATMAANGNMKNILKTVDQTDLVSGAWTKVELDLATIFADGDDVCGLSIVVVGDANSSILFRNGHLSKAAESGTEHG